MSDSPWVSVKDRLPTNDWGDHELNSVEVLTWSAYHGGSPVIGWYYYEEKKWYYCDGRLDGISHWAPIPTTPDKE